MPKKRTKRVTRRCDCGCCTLVFEKTVWDDGATWYNVSVEDSRYDHDANGFLGRVRSAARVLFGKPVTYSDVFMENPEDFDELLRELDGLRRWGAGTTPDSLLFEDGRYVGSRWMDMDEQVPA